MVWPKVRSCQEILWGLQQRPELLAATAGSSMEPVIAEAKTVKAKITYSIEVTAACVCCAIETVVIIITMVDIAPSIMAVAAKSTMNSTAATTISISAA